jgi:hypothetical protein
LGYFCWRVLGAFSLAIRVPTFTPVVLVFPDLIIFNPGFVPFGISTCEKEGPWILS